MSADAYLNGILLREAVDTGLYSPARAVQSTLMPLLQGWAGSQLLNVHPSGSFAKGTANRSGTDIDLFISLSEGAQETLKQIYEKLFVYLQSNNYTPKRQNVSINIRVSGLDVDLVPARRQDPYSSDHSLYLRRRDTWQKTNAQTHINHVIAGNRIAESRLLKLWRIQKGLDFPSFYLELVVMRALSGYINNSIGVRVWKVLEYLRDTFSSARFVDPANTNNVISDDLTDSEKAKVRAAAIQSLAAPTWDKIIV